MKTKKTNVSYCPLTPTLLALLVGGMIAYVYFLNSSVVHVVLQKETMRDIQDLKNDIALLEADYIAAQHVIAERVTSLDVFETERNKIFVSRVASDSLVVTR